MATETIFLFLLVSGFLVAVVLAIFCLRYFLQLRHARRRLKLTEKRLGEYRRRLEGMRGQLAAGRSFSAAGAKIGLREEDDGAGESPPSELRLRLQQGQQRSSGTVERYRLVASMARRGLSAEDISAILQLPSGETEELLKLAQVGRAGE